MNVTQLLRFGGVFGGVLQLSPSAATESKRFVVRPRGFEPLTFCSGGRWRQDVKALFALRRSEVAAPGQFLGQPD